MTKTLSVRCAFNGIPPELRRLGEETVADSLLAYYGDAEAVGAAQQMAREFKDTAGLGSWSSRNTVAAMEACRTMGLTPCQADKMGFLVRVVDNKEGPC